MPGEAPQELLERGQELLDEFERLRFSAAGGYVRPRSPEPVTRPPGVLADAIGATAAGSPAERQELLETLDPAVRLERAVAMFAPVIEQMRQRSADSALRRWSEPARLTSPEVRSPLPEGEGPARVSQHSGRRTSARCARLPTHPPRRFSRVGLRPHAPADRNRAPGPPRRARVADLLRPPDPARHERADPSEVTPGRKTRVDTCALTVPVRPAAAR